MTLIYNHTAWNNGSSLSNDAIANPEASPLASTTYEVTVSDGTYNDVGSITVNVQEVAASATDKDTICIGSYTTLNTIGGTSYSWQPTTVSNPMIANPVASPGI